VEWRRAGEERQGRLGVSPVVDGADVVVVDVCECAGERGQPSGAGGSPWTGFTLTLGGQPEPLPGSPCTPGGFTLNRGGGSR